MKKALAFMLFIGTSLGLARPASAQWAYDSYHAFGVFHGALNYPASLDTDLYRATSLNMFFAYAGASNGDRLVIGCQPGQPMTLQYLIPVQKNLVQLLNHLVIDNRLDGAPASLTITVDQQDPAIFTPDFGQQIAFTSTIPDPVLKYDYLSFSLSLKDPEFAGDLINQLSNAQQTITVSVNVPLASPSILRRLLLPFLKPSPYTRQDTVPVENVQQALSRMRTACTAKS